MKLSAALKLGFQMLRFEKKAPAAFLKEKQQKVFWLLLICHSLLAALMFGIAFPLAIKWLSMMTEEMPAFLSNVPLMVLIGAVFGFVITFILAFIMPGLIHWCANKLGGKATFSQFLSIYFAGTFAYTVVYLPVFILQMWTMFAYPSIYNMLLPLWMVVGIYALCINIWMIREAHKISTGRAIGAYLLPILFFVGALFIILILVAVIAYFGLLNSP